MFDNVTSITFSLVSVRQTMRTNATAAHGMCCGVQKSTKIKTKLRLNSDRSGVLLSLLVCASLETWLLVQVEARIHTETVRSDFRPNWYPL